MNAATLQELHMDQLAVHPKNVRRDVGNVVELANSITEQGILQPLVVAPSLDGGEGFTIIAGHRRHAAAKLANVDSLPCVVREDLDTEPKQLVAMLVENTQRTDLTMTEEAEAYQALLEFPDWNVKTVARATGRSQATVRKRLLLNKLPDEAKGQLDNQTLNVDQALVLVDFVDDEEATAKLLEAAAEGRNWNYTVELETRRRDAPMKVANANAALEAAGIELVPESQRYSGPWNRLYEHADARSIEDHAAAGHRAFVSIWGEIEWFEKPTKAPKVKPELTEEELAAKRRDAELTAALDIAHAVRAEHFKTVIGSPPEGAADEALYRLLVRNLHSHVNLFAEITGRHPDSESDHQGIKAALAAMTVEQMALLLHMAERSQEDELLKLWAWDAGDYRHTWGPKAWIEDLGSVYHYELSAVEQEVLDHFKQAHDARLAEAAAEDQEEEEDEDDE